MTNKTKAAIEEAANKFAPIDKECYEDNAGFIAGALHVIEHPERYDLTTRKPLGIQEASELFDQAFTEQISFSRFVELINEGVRNEK